MLAHSLYLLSQGAGPRPWTHSRLRVYCLSAAVCVTNACLTRGIKNNPVTISISQNNCLQSALLGRLATKIRLHGVCVCVFMCVHVCLCVICKPISPHGEAHGLCPFVLWCLLSVLGVPESCLPAHRTMPSSIL